MATGVKLADPENPQLVQESWWYLLYKLRQTQIKVPPEAALPISHIVIKTAMRDWAYRESDKPASKLRCDKVNIVSFVALCSVYVPQIIKFCRFIQAKP